MSDLQAVERAFDSGDDVFEPIDGAALMRRKVLLAVNCEEVYAKTVSGFRKVLTVNLSLGLVLSSK